MSKLTNILAPLAIAAGLAGTAKAADYIQESRFGLFGAGHTITYTHTENMLVNVPHRVTCRDQFGGFYETTVFSQEVREVVTSQCRRSYVDWDKSIVAAPGNLLTAVGRALTPQQRCDVPMYIAPMPQCRQPTVQPCYPVQPAPRSPCR